MKYILMFLLVVPVATFAQSFREGLYAGISAGFAHYTTYWYYYRADGRPRHDNYPEHSINRN